MRNRERMLTALALIALAALSLSCSTGNDESLIPTTPSGAVCDASRYTVVATLQSKLVQSWAPGQIPTLSARVVDSQGQPMDEACPYPRSIAWKRSGDAACEWVGDQYGLSVSLKCVSPGMVCVQPSSTYNGALLTGDTCFIVVG